MQIYDNMYSAAIIMMMMMIIIIITDFYRLQP